MFAGHLQRDTPPQAGDKPPRYIPLAHTPQLARCWEKSQRTNDEFGTPAGPLPKRGTSPRATFPSPTPRNWHILGTNPTHERRVREAGPAPRQAGDEPQRYIALAHTPRLAHSWDQSQRTNDEFGSPRACPSPSWGQAPALHFSLTGSGRGVGAARVASGQVIIRAWYKMRMEVPACRGRR